MAFVGRFTGTTILVIVFHVKLYHHEMKWYHIALDVSIAAFGIFGCIFGVTYSTIQIILRNTVFTAKDAGVDPEILKGGGGTLQLQNGGKISRDF